MRKVLLELFSGTGSVGKVAELLGYSVVSLDLKDAKITTDILEWDYAKLDPDEIDIIWASPPCIEYSIAKTTGVRKIDYANRIVKKTLEITNYFKPKYWFIENPQTGLLKSQEFMSNLGFVDVDYCKYGFNYRKRTRIWNNLNGLWKPRPLCKKDCGKMIGNKHLETAQRLASGKKNEWGTNPIKHSQRDLFKIPSTLIYEIFNTIS